VPDFSTTTKVAEIARRNGRLAESERFVPEEAPVAFSYAGSTHAVMMATPADLEDFAVGFSLTEGIITDPCEIEAIEVLTEDKGIDVQIQLADAQNDALTTRRRHMAGPVGCGLCGIESIEQAVRVTPSVRASSLTLGAEDVVEAVRLLNGQQPLHMVTRAVHGAGFYVPGEGLIAVREDVGRHNALDKLAGALARSDAAAAGGFVVVTSRCSYEMVQKAAAIGASAIAAVSAPTSLAIETAEQADIALVAFVREGRLTAYACADRITA